jgi:hypothetical protein
MLYRHRYINRTNKKDAALNKSFYKCNVYFISITYSATYTHYIRRGVYSKGVYI